MEMTVKLTKHFHRDFSLYVSMWWRGIFHERFEQLVGAYYSDYIAVNDGQSSLFYALEEDEQGLKKATLDFLKNHPQAYFDYTAEFRKEAHTTRQFLQETQGRGTLDLGTVRTLRKRFALLFPGLRLSIRIPGPWADEIRQGTDKEMGEKIINASFENRRLTDGIFEEIDFTLRAMLARKLAQSGQNPLLAKFLTETEAEALADGREIDLERVKERRKGYVFCKGRLYPTSDYTAIFKENGYEYVEEKTAPGAELKGTPAFKGGLVKGKVRKVMALEQVGAFQNGEVLVSPMTLPQYLPAMNKACAIVTDEGGITCHAAIVARELGKPCVIGTKHATKVLQDGDRVEVDSEKGTVRKV